MIIQSSSGRHHRNSEVSLLSKVCDGTCRINLVLPGKEVFACFPARRNIKRDGLEADAEIGRRGGVQ